MKNYKCNQKNNIEKENKMGDRITLESFFNTEAMDRALIIQNVWGGPLILSDLGDLLLYPGETFMWHLSSENEKMLHNSQSLQTANRWNLIRQLTAEQYQRELDAQEYQMRESGSSYEMEMDQLLLNDSLILDVDKIDLTRDAQRNPEGKKRTVVTSQNLKQDPIAYGKLYSQMKVNQPDLTVAEFSQMVEQNHPDIRWAMSQQNQSFNPMQGSGKATVANPNGPTTVEMGNFSRDGHLNHYGEKTANSYTNRGHRNTPVESPFGNPYDDDPGFDQDIDLAVDDDGGPRGFRRL